MTQKPMPTTTANIRPTVTMGRRHFTPAHLLERVRSRASSGSVLQDVVYGAPGPAQLDAHHDLRHAVDDAEQAEQQREGDRTDAGTGEQHDTERDGHKPAQDEQRAGARGLAALEGSEDL